MGLRAFMAYQSFIIADAGLTVETLAGSHPSGNNSGPSAVAASSASALSGSPAQAFVEDLVEEGSGQGAAGSGGGGASSTAATIPADASPTAGTVAEAARLTALTDSATSANAAALTDGAMLTDAATLTDAGASTDAARTAGQSVAGADDGACGVSRDGVVDVPRTTGSSPPLSQGSGDGGDGGGAGDSSGVEGDGAEKSNKDAPDKTGATEVTIGWSAAAAAASASDGAPRAGSESFSAVAAQTQQNGPRSSKALVLGYFVAYARTRWLPTWSHPENGKKGPVVPGTIANPSGAVTVNKDRSLSCARVSMVGIKSSFLVPGLASRRLKLSNVPDEMLVVELTDFKSMKISEVAASLLLLCTNEPEEARIVKEIAAGSFEARPSRQPSLVQSGLELEKVADEANSRAGGVGGAVAFVGSTDAGEDGVGDNGGQRRQGDGGGGTRVDPATAVAPVVETNTAARAATGHPAQEASACGYLCEPTVGSGKEAEDGDGCAAGRRWREWGGSARGWGCCRSRCHCQWDGVYTRRVVGGGASADRTHRGSARKLDGGAVCKPAIKWERNPV
eukprot:TRINITY_DN8693_c0_g1_i1.p1 TRINITY_DN8693_c0_g1~~TRINITY_DN8693_c0_g1_i1.p1  ORF type:complete len:565 (-),score=90.30 TRINITY_DN8693_c0_g1_i1:344-2038(-)